MSPGRLKSLIVLLSLIAVMAIGACGALTMQLLNAADESSSRQQLQQVKKTLEGNLSKLRTDQKNIAVWDDTFNAVAHGDRAWLQKAVGERSYVFFKHDQSLIFLPDRSILFWAMKGKARLVNSLPKSSLAQYETLIQQLKRSILSTSTGVGVTASLVGYMHIEGGPALVSVSFIVPQSVKLNDLRLAPVLVSVKKLDQATLLRMTDQLGINDVRSTTLQQVFDPLVSLQLRDVTGHEVGTLTWQPETPGKKIFTAGAPMATAFLVGFLALLTAFGRILYSAATSIERAAACADFRATHDHLTGLMNRAALLELVEQSIAARKESSVLIFDLDRFKQVNDTLGHSAGDELIKSFGVRVQKEIGDDGVVGRLGGDEFAAIIWLKADACRDLCHRIIEATCEPFDVLDTQVFIGVSIGVTDLDWTTTAHDMLRRADIALYAAKKSGKNCFRLFTADMDEELLQKKKIENELRHALQCRQGLTVHYQPQICSKTHIIRGYEALVRWNHPRLGFIPPIMFIPIAEECGLIDCLDMWVLEEACTSALNWRHDQFVAVNVSSAAFRAPGLAIRALNVIERCGIAPQRVQLEITETALLKSENLASAEIEALRHRGVSIALDDFGTGYSSLSHLQKLDVDKIKIDKSFVDESYTPEAIAIISAVVTLGRSMGVEITAEGVETEDQAKFLRAAGCTGLQGYLFGRPLPADQVFKRQDEAIIA